eukprot:13845197-Alexandrium_andersonii.AAC.1
MSASLVGSEMCIRDSASIMPSMSSGNLNAPTMMVAEKIADGLLGCGSRSVSYTHLTLPTICSV